MSSLYAIYPLNSGFYVSFGWVYKIYCRVSFWFCQKQKPSYQIAKGDHIYIYDFFNFYAYCLCLAICVLSQ